MTFLIAAAGTGGHVFPGLSVGEALVDLGVSRDQIVYVGGDRLEATVYPGEGFRFLQVELAGLKRSLTLANARIPGVVLRARKRISEEIGAIGIDVVLGMGGYVTIPAALAARKRRIPFFNAEQNAEAGLANRVAARLAEETFVAFPDTGGLPDGSWVGNPVRRVFWEFDRPVLRPAALDRYDLDPDLPVVGVFGGSLGAGAINEAIAATLAVWGGPRIQVLHLTGSDHLEAMSERPASPDVTWRRIGFEKRMDAFFAVSDLVVSRAGGAVAELTATASPSVLIPGRFGSGGHQVGNARFLEGAGAAVVVEEDDLERLGAVIVDLVSDSHRRLAMQAATRAIAKPDAARTIARVMIEASI
ncbi:MAG TPA: UDP-N-acetylglucosamine--N-acetylmuramyl-(pentapeptide) pyrophosphoryl-undecaprenol N-acetylglucosamine transferase [Acidimicrobiia bacterium]|nr:UDP-N-acetylglucosamine--N-acetylmuramyl-(pentapeptide) pyrophosphoryl-undecaprenol N-acetylglucosamine transferase [Acidimicrobiia bacterium]